jgi:hypothetical protein
MARRRKPFDPAAAAKAALEKAERAAEMARLKAMGAVVAQDRGGKLVSARLSNVFNLLLSRRTITQNQYDAAYRLAQDWARWKGLEGRPPTFGERIDCSGGSRELATDRMIGAGRAVARALFDLEPLDRAILEAFMAATVEQDRPMAWRGIMARLGVTVRDRQTQTFVGALEALRRIYQEGRRNAA